MALMRDARWHRWVLLLCALVPLLASAADGLQAQVDRQRLMLNETLTLRLTASGTLTGEPDWSALDSDFDSDFDILNQSQSSRTSIINGAMSRVREWTLELAPRHAGILHIPALQLAGARSQALSVEVVEPDAQALSERPLRLLTEIDTPEPYVQQPFLYRVRVLYRSPLQRAVLTPPSAEGARIEQQGEDRNDRQMLDGQSYEVIERTYRVIPERSGTLVIEGPRLDAWLSDSRRAPNPFDRLNQSFAGQLFQDFPQVPGRPGQRVIERGEDRRIEVRPQPEGYGPLWLPATSVQLDEQWSPMPPSFKVGEPLTRTLTLTVKGLTAAQLPGLDLGSIPGAQLYPEPAESEDLPGTDSTPVALKRMRVTLVPTRPGVLEIPEFRLPWWDLHSEQPQVAVIPARQVEVAPSATPATPASASAQADVPRSETQTARDADSAPGESALWRWLAAVFALGWVITAGLWWRSRRGAGRISSSQPPQAQTPSAASAAFAIARGCLNSACASGEADAARAALLEWGRICWPSQPPRGLGELGARLENPALSARLIELDRLLYAPPGTREQAVALWDGKGFCQMVTPVLVAAESRTAATRPEAQPLPLLYPDTSASPDVRRSG